MYFKTRDRTQERATNHMMHFQKSAILIGCFRKCSVLIGGAFQIPIPGLEYKVKKNLIFKSFSVAFCRILRLFLPKMRKSTNFIREKATNTLRD